MAAEPISGAYFVNYTHLFASVCVTLLSLLRKGPVSLSLLSFLGNDFVNTFPPQRIHTIEELLVRVSLGLSVYLRIVAR
jgi:hypothetical protein